MDKRSKLILSVSAFVAFAFLFALGPKIYPDTAGYVNGGLVLPPLYPFIISVFRTLFNDHFGYPLVAFQLMLGGWAIYFISRFVAKLYALSSWAFLILVLLFATPYFGFSIQAGNAITTEGLAYPLFLFATAYLLDGVSNRSFRSLMLFIFISILLVLTRKQFGFLFPIGLVAILFHAVKDGSPRKAIFLSLLLVGGLGAANLIERANNYFRHDQFATFTYSGIMLIAPAIFVAKQSDINVIQDKQQASLFQDIYNESTRRKLTLESLEEVEKDMAINFYGQYFINYQNLMVVANQALDKVYASEIHSVSERSAVTDREAKRLAITLIRENPKRYAMLFFLNASYGLGGHGIGDGFGVRGNYFAILQIFAVLLTLISTIRFPQSAPFAVSIISIFLLHMANVVELSVVAPALDRYTFYTSTLMMAILFAFIAKGIEEKMVELD